MPNFVAKIYNYSLDSIFPICHNDATKSFFIFNDPKQLNKKEV